MGLTNCYCKTLQDNMDLLIGGKFREFIWCMSELMKNSFIVHIQLYFIPNGMELNTSTKSF